VSGMSQHGAGKNTHRARRAEQRGNLAFHEPERTVIGAKVKRSLLSHSVI
jgi:hypothetical protein